MQFKGKFPENVNTAYEEKQLSTQNYQWKGKTNIRKPLDFYLDHNTKIMYYF